MTQIRRENANLAQFKALIKQTTNNINVIFFPAMDTYPATFTTSIVVGNTTHILYTQKNELRRFKNITALTKALELDHTSPSLKLLISA